MIILAITILSVTVGLIVFSYGEGFIKGKKVNESNEISQYRSIIKEYKALNKGRNKYTKHLKEEVQTWRKRCLRKEAGIRKSIENLQDL